MPLIRRAPGSGAWQTLAGRRKLLLLAAFVTIAAVAATICFVRHDTLPASAALRIGTRVITTEEFDRYANTLRAVYDVHPAQRDGAAEPDAFRRGAAKSLAVSLVLQQAADEQGIRVSEAAVRASRDRFVLEELGQGPQSREKFIDALGARGISEDAVLDEIKRQLTAVLLWKTMWQDVSVSDEDVSKAFTERKDQLGSPERRIIRNIVLRTKDDADRILADLRAGARFEALAASRSRDGITRASGGLLGQTTEARLEGDYGQAAFGARKGDLFGPVQTASGWNVGKVETIIPAEPASFDKSRDHLRTQLEVERVEAKWRRWMGDRLRAADVQYSDAYRPPNPFSVDDVVPGRPAGSAGGQR